MPGHAAQFYGDDRDLAESVRNFLAEGLAVGGAGVVVATAAHRRLFGEPAAGVLTVDADEMLSGFLTEDGLDVPRFRAAAGDLIRTAAGPGRPVRVYGEMVALLWDTGRVALAIELEGMWNDLAARLPFSLLCGYPARLLAAGDTPGAAAGRVCRLHTSVVRDFPSDLASARAARMFVLGALGSRVDEGTGADAAIVTGELAANAVLHARSAFTVTVSYLPDGARIAIRDAAPLADGSPLVVKDGHGLDLVARLAARWAVEPLTGGKVIWADLC